MENYVMRHTRYLLILALAVAVAVTVVAPSRVKAIVYGFVDTNNIFSNSGAFIVKSPTTGAISPICSGTLISSNVFLTASHCTAFFENDLAPLGYTAFVSFDNPIPFGGRSSNQPTLIPVPQVVTNPNFNQAQSDTGDIAVLLVRASETRGIALAQLPPAGLLDQLSTKNGLKSAVFTPVGYGLQNRVTGGRPPFFQDRNPVRSRYSLSRSHP